jgi:multidrug efflux pump subunit AcrA (membrane-fusion protein)
MIIKFNSNLIIYALLGTVLCIGTGCGGKDNSENPELTPRANVVAANIERKSVNDTLFFNASSLFNNKAVVQAPITGYLSSMRISNGMNISKGDFLFEIVTKEFNALQSSPGLLDTLNLQNNAGKVHILAPAYGQITDLNFRQGQYVQEGNALCTIIDLSSILFKLYVPVENRAYVKNGISCGILMPGGQVINGRVTNLLATTEINTQTETYYVKPLNAVNIPEGVNIKAFIVIHRSGETQILPRTAVLSDETLSEFWVMKIINDTTAVKITVKPGKIIGNEIEITKPEFSQDDKVIITGNYGLPDTALVSISTEKEEK